MAAAVVSQRFTRVAADGAISLGSLITGEQTTIRTLIIFTSQGGLLIGGASLAGESTGQRVPANVPLVIPLATPAADYLTTLFFLVTGTDRVTFDVTVDFNT